MIIQGNEERRNPISGNHAGVRGQDMATRCEELGVLDEAVRLS